MQNTTDQRQLRGFSGLVRSHLAWFLLFGMAALLLRFYFVFHFPMYTPDSLVYGDFAKSWIQAHTYGISSDEGAVPADFRLPGYPAYLALSFLVAGIDHYGPACVGQVFVDLGTCFLIAALAFRLAGGRAATWAFALAALCPFLANYTAVALTETWSIFFSALALLLAVHGADAIQDRERPLRAWTWCGLAVGMGVLLRPDGGMVLIALLLWLGWKFLRTQDRGFARVRRLRVFWSAILVGAFTFVPLIPWTLRNAITLHEFRPIPTVTAAAPGEFYPHGFVRWLFTWVLDYASLEDIGFNVSGEAIPFDRVPVRAFDTTEQRQRTETLFASYNATLVMTPDLDEQFAALARERIAPHLLRYYIVLPLGRALDMWLRPRTEMLPVGIHWWEFQDDPRDSTIAIAFAALNLLLLGAAARGAWKLRWSPCVGLLLTFVVVRTLLLTVFALPEPRYVLECYPVVLALVACALRPAP